MFKPEEVKKGYWFYDVIRKKPVQVREENQQDIIDQRIYVALPITRELLIRFGFKESFRDGMFVYEKKGFCIYRRKNSEAYQIMEFEELTKELKFIHEVQKKYREDVEEV
jgi:hypothetical protein